VRDDPRDASSVPGCPRHHRERRVQGARCDTGIGSTKGLERAGPRGMRFVELSAMPFVDGQVGGPSHLRRVWDVVLPFGNSAAAHKLGGRQANSLETAG